jgi:NAD(P)-dependent dehydrogenase (short-subunit alcohol dehydrogenase family)
VPTSQTVGRAEGLDAIRDATIVLTGATTGIGRATALAIADRAGRLILHGLEREHDIADLLPMVRAAMHPEAQLLYFTADYGDLANVTRLARDIRAATDRIDILINNAARPGPPTHTVSGAGNEVTLQTNYLAPVVLTTALIDLIGNGALRHEAWCQVLLRLTEATR